MTGRLLQQCRQRSGLSQREAAQRIKVARETLSYYENEQRPVPDDVVLMAARVYQAPELLMAQDTPLNPVYLGHGATLLETLLWLQEELAEAQQALDRQEEDLRKGRTDKHRQEAHAAQVYDLVTALGGYFCALVRETDADIDSIHEQHVEKVAKYRKVLGDGREVA